VVFFAFESEADPGCRRRKFRCCGDDGEEVKRRMRKYFALTVVALMALSFALTMVGCGQRESTTESTETTPPTTEMPMDTSMLGDTAMVDTSMQH
jgi:hypothetical protein